MSPKMIKVHVVPTRFVLTLLPAAVMTGPAVTVPVLKEAGSVRLNWMPATELVEGSNEMGRLMVVPAWPDAVPTVKVGNA